MVAAIRTEGLAKSFGRTAALRPLDLEVAKGEVIGYLGPNGAGKTTTIRLLLGLIRASAGRAEIFGVDCPGRPRRRSSPRVVRARRRQPVAGADRHRDAARPRPGPRQLDEAYHDELIGGSSSTRPSGCAPTRRATARRWCSSPLSDSRADLLILDEPTSGLDPLMEQMFRECVGEAQRPRPDGLLVVAHLERGRGALRPGRDPARRAARRGRHPGGDAPPVGPLGRRGVRRRGPDLSGIPGVTGCSRPRAIGSGARWSVGRAVARGARRGRACTGW